MEEEICEEIRFDFKCFCFISFSVIFIVSYCYFITEAFINGFNYIMFILFLVYSCVLLGFIILFIIALINNAIDYFKERKEYIMHLESENIILHKHNTELITELYSINSKNGDEKDVK